MDYAVVTPARNERHNLPRLAGAILAQSRRPECWVIVDDGSDDGTTEWARDLVADHPWIILVERSAEKGGDVLAGRREGRDLLAFRRGIHALPRQFDVVSKVDADLAFAEDYW